MAADNNVFDLKMLDSVLQNRCKIPVMDRGDIADIPLDEQVSRVSSGLYARSGGVNPNTRSTEPGGSVLS